MGAIVFHQIRTAKDSMEPKWLPVLVLREDVSYNSKYVKFADMQKPVETPIEDSSYLHAGIWDQMYDPK
jgi:hypothetical protein